MEQVVEWQSRPLDQVYPIVYLGCTVVKIRQNKQVINKAIYLALGVIPIPESLQLQDSVKNNKFICSIEWSEI